MNRCRFRGFQGTYKALAGVGWYAHSQSPSQRLLEASVREVQTPDERLGVVRAVYLPCTDRGVEGVSRVGLPACTPGAGGAGCEHVPGWGVQKRPLAPPPSRPMRGDLAQFFPSFQELLMAISLGDRVLVLEGRWSDCEAQVVDIWTTGALVVELTENPLVELLLRPYQVERVSDDAVH